MKIKIFDKELDLHYSFRMLMMYEQIQEKSLDFQKVTLNDLVVLFYTAIISTLQYNKVEGTLKYADYMNWLDDNGGEKTIVEFTNWYVSELAKQNELAPEEKEDKKKSKKSLPKNV